MSIIRTSAAILCNQTDPSSVTIRLRNDLNSGSNYITDCKVNCDIGNQTDHEYAGLTAESK